MSIIEVDALFVGVAFGMTYGIGWFIREHCIYDFGYDSWPGW